MQLFNIISVLEKLTSGCNLLFGICLSLAETALHPNRQINHIKLILKTRSFFSCKKASLFLTIIIFDNFLQRQPWGQSCVYLANFM